MSTDEAGRPVRGPGWHPDAEVLAFVDAALGAVLDERGTVPRGTLKRVQLACVERFGAERAPSSNSIAARRDRVRAGRRAAEHAEQMARVASHGARLRDQVAATAQALAERPAPTDAELRAALDAVVARTRRAKDDGSRPGSPSAARTPRRR